MEKKRFASGGIISPHAEGGEYVVPRNAGHNCLIGLVSGDIEKGLQEMADNVVRLLVRERIKALKSLMKDAERAENYELCAKLRDELKTLEREQNK